MNASPYMQLRRQLEAVFPASEAQALARWVMEERHGYAHADLLLGKDTELSAVDREELENIGCRLAKKEPVQYVLGQTHFCGHTFKVAPGVLIPRPETEEIVRRIVEENPSPKRILDMGTGSGCIAVTLSLAYPEAEVEAWDISPAALGIARDNAQRLGAQTRFVEQDILSPSAPGHQWDLIVSNPPYICDSEAASMDSNVLDHEPHLALFVPDDRPLLFYESIVRYAASNLSCGGALYVEVNRQYGEAVRALMEREGLVEATLHKDMYGNDRCVCGKKTQKEG